MHHSVRFLFLILGFCWINSCPTAVEAAPDYLFQSDCQSLDQWEFLDLKGGGKVVMEEDFTAPQYDSRPVISLRGEEALLLAKGVRLKEGTILALWKDPEPREHDADGIIVFEADYPDDLTVPRNTRDRRAHFLVEQDSDRGFQIKFQKPGMDAEPVIEKIHVGLTNDDSWNRSGWMYQKVQIGDGKIRAKYWSTAVPEPEGWPIEIDHPNPKEGRVGVKVWSGKARLAYFAVAKDDIPPITPMLDLAITREIVVVGPNGEMENQPEFRLFLNLVDIDRNSLRLMGALLPEGSSKTYGFQLDCFPGPEVSLLDDPSFAKALQDLPKTPRRVEVLVHLDQPFPGQEASTKLGTVRRYFEYRTADQYETRFIELRDRAENIYSSESDKLSDVALEATAALSLLDYARSNLAEAEFGPVDRTLGYVEECLDPSIQLTDYRFGEIELPALNLVMGATYSISVPWESLGIRKSETLTARLEITDDLIVDTPIRVETRIPASDWKGGETTTVLDFHVPYEFPPGSTEPIHKPAIREGFHRLFVSLWDESGEPVWLDNPNADRTRYFGQRYEIGRLYVTPNPIEVSDIRLIPNVLEGGLACMATLVNHGATDIKPLIRFSLDTPGGFQSSTGLTEATLQPERETKISFDVGSPTIAGDLTARFEIHFPEGFVSHAERQINLPEPFEVEVAKSNRVFKQDEGYVVPIKISAPDSSRAPTQSVSVQVYSDDVIEKTVEWNPSESPELDLDL
ncbi:MAG: hypothetical protein KC917_14145, partial [Candidatus Omnitrophica bacterium]|nr:hypothetical protein [Candidatus Omnitrophota bacterium]